MPRRYPIRWRFPRRFGCLPALAVLLLSTFAVAHSWQPAESRKTYSAAEGELVYEPHKGGMIATDLRVKERITGTVVDCVTLDNPCYGTVFVKIRPRGCRSDALDKWFLKSWLCHSEESE